MTPTEMQEFLRELMRFEMAVVDNGACINLEAIAEYIGSVEARIGEAEYFSAEYQARLEFCRATNRGLMKERDDLQAELAATRKAAHMGMTAAASEGRHALKTAKELHAETKPEVLASEREANALLTAEIESLQSRLAQAESEAALWHDNGRRLQKAYVEDVAELHAKLASAEQGEAVLPGEYRTVEELAIALQAKPSDAQLVEREVARANLESLFHAMIGRGEPWHEMGHQGLRNLRAIARIPRGTT